MIEPSLFQENERTAPSSDHRKFCNIGSLQCEAGGRLDDMEVAYETWGSLNRDRSNAILVCHALTGDSHAVGWWQSMVGPGRPIDTDQFFVICSNVLGGCQGTTGPTSFAPGAVTHYGSSFPIITIGDIVGVQRRLLDRLQIEKLHCVAGGSMGGMQALEWSVQDPHRVQRAFVTASCAAHDGMQIGFNEAARQAIMRDSKWHGGDYPLDEPPSEGLAVARMIGHLTFLSEVAFSKKFSRRLQGKAVPSYHMGVEFEVESYLKHQGEKFTTRFDANSLLLLTRAIDYYELKSLEPSQARFQFISFTSDWIYPSHHSKRLREMASAAGKQAEHHVIDLPLGHDAFLLDGQIQGDHLRRFLE